jgi:hypothetical protein
MASLSLTIARRTVADLDLEESNRALAEHWLSLWVGDALPMRASFNPAHMKPFLASIIMFNVVPGESVIVRLAGTGYRQILGAELTGQDWIALAPQDHRATRLRIFSTVAAGAIAVAHRLIAMTVGDDYVSEEIVLPFGREPGGAVPVLVHVNFKPGQFIKIKSVAQVTADPLDFKLISLAVAPI